MNIKDIGNKKFIGSGMCGKCYKLQNNYVYKKFNNPMCLSDIDRFKYFLNYKCDSFMFPFDFIYDDTKFYGHISKFALGDKLFDVFSSSNIEDMCKNLEVLEQDIEYVSRGRILLFDFHDQNILYDGNKFRVIDIDEYSYSRAYNEDESFIRNMGYLKNVINVSIFDKLEETNSKFLLKRLDKYENSTFSSSDLLYKIKREIDKYYNENIKTFDDIKKINR